MADTPARGAPNPDRPRLEPNIERVLEPVDRRSAAGYGAVEEVVERIDRVLEEGAITVQIEVTDTVVHRLMEARDAAAPDAEIPRPNLPEDPGPDDDL